MKRLHVHVGVHDLKQSIRFYATLFGAQPTVLRDDYAKWQLDDPRVNFAISTFASKKGLDHLGIQTENGEELEDIGQRLAAAEVSATPQKGASCCYAKSDKYWTLDPQGIRNPFHTMEAGLTYSGATGSESRSERPSKSLLRMNVLFLCTGNSARSILAEAYLNSAGRGRFKAYSAGSHPGQGEPVRGGAAWRRTASTRAAFARRVGTSSPSRRAQARLRLHGLRQRGGEMCPIWPGQPITAHWGVRDPAAVTGSDEEKRKAFLRAFTELSTRINLLLALPIAKLDRLALKQKLDEIGKTGTRTPA